MAAMLIGTFCTDSSRRVAVTVISSKEGEVELASGLAFEVFPACCAIVGADSASKAIKCCETRENPCRLFIFSRSSEICYESEALELISLRRHNCKRLQ